MSPRSRARTATPPPPGSDCNAIGTAYLDFAREEPGLFATAFALPQRHAYDAAEGDTDRLPLGQLRRALDELVEAGVLAQHRREGVEYPIWAAVHGIATLAGEGPLRDAPEDTRRLLEQRTLSFLDESLAELSGRPAAQ